MNRSEIAAIGVDVGGTHIKAAACAEDGTIVGQWTRPTDSAERTKAQCTRLKEDSRFKVQVEDDAPGFAEAVRELVREMDAPDAPVGLAAPGLAARDGRAIAWMPGRLHGLAGLDWGEYLARPVRVLNDAHAALLGERWAGAARGLDDVVMLTLGTGVGGAVVSGGRLLTGRMGRAGHLGHLCLDVQGAPDIVGTPGSLEDTIGECSLPARTGGRFSTTRELLAAAAKGDGEAAVAWAKSVRALGCAVASLVNIFDPEAIVLGGGVARAGAVLFGPLAAVLDEVEWRPSGAGVRVLAAELGEWAGSVGAAKRGMKDEG